ncbi:hypothetical protein PEDI_34770 [Persicobacter diffluens]|uniref:Uncharacterized protein n=1 Tax=Persicobacter diffluens TaxID=981 RepID=A0AAN4W1S0_9BACT|nr:hypothetical protein PEDI_34770 [Persicobacter diffluens]
MICQWLYSGHTHKENEMVLWKLKLVVDKQAHCRRIYIDFPTKGDCRASNENGIEVSL